MPAADLPKVRAVSECFKTHGAAVSALHAGLAELPWGVEEFARRRRSLGAAVACAAVEDLADGTDAEKRSRRSAYSAEWKRVRVPPLCVAGGGVVEAPRVCLTARRLYPLRHPPSRTTLTPPHTPARPTT